MYLNSTMTATYPPPYYEDRHASQATLTMDDPPPESYKLSKLSDKEKDSAEVQEQVLLENALTESAQNRASPSPGPKTQKDEQSAAESNENAEKPEQERGPDYPTSWRLGLIVTGLTLSIFCLSLDNTIISTAIPKITDQFRSLEDVGWYGSAYLLTTCCLTLIFGKLYTFYSTKWIYLMALGIFELGSLVCGAAPNSVALIIGRAVAGIGAAGLFSGAVLIITQTMPLEKRPAYTGLLSAMLGVSSVAGPLMGGAFTDHLTWRWCFYINLPIGAATALFIVLFFKAPQSIKDNSGLKGQLAQLDLPGSFFFLPAIISVLLALQWGGTKYAWNSARIIALFVVFGVLLFAFMVVQWWRQEKATVPPRLIKNRNVWGAGLFSFCVGSAFFILVYYLPIWFQAVRGVTATKSGIMVLPLLLTFVLSALLAGVIITITGYYTPFMIISAIIATIGSGLLTTLKTSSGSNIWIGYQAVFGIGAGLGLQQSVLSMQAVLSKPDIPTGTALMVFAQSIGGALSISIAQNVFQNQLYKNLAIQVPQVNARKVVNAGATALRQAVPAEYLSAVLEAYSGAITETFYVSVAMAGIGLFGALVMQWVSVKGRTVQSGAAA